MPPTARGAMRLLRLTPRSIISAPERVVLKFGCLMIGVGLLISAHTHDGTLGSYPQWIVYELGVTFILGGGASLLGIFGKRRTLERFGVATTGFACLSYAVAILATYGISRFAGITIFLAMSVACFLRLAISTAGVQVLLAAWAHASYPDERTELDS